MRFDISRWTRHAMLGLAVAAIASTGCSSSGWKMPSPSKMFAWGKKPSETTVAGTGPSSLTYPESPASKQTPTALATNPVTKPTTPGVTNPTPGVTNPIPGVTNPMAPAPTANTVAATRAPGGLYTPPAAGGASYTPPTAGAAAAANGYATGPYNTYGQAGASAALATNGVPGRAPAATPNNAYAQAAPQAPAFGNSGVPATPVGYAPSSPYGMATASNPGLPSTQTYAGAAPNRNANVAAAAPYPNMNTSGMAFPTANGARPAAPTMAPNLSGAPAGYGAPAPSAAAGLAAMPGVNPTAMPTASGAYTPIGTNGAPQNFAQASMPTSQGFAAPGMTNAMPASNGMGGVPAQTAGYSNPGQFSATTAAYRPGTTSRETGYNFGTPTGASNVATFPGATTAPSMATGTANPGYSLPPSSTLNR